MTDKKDSLRAPTDLDPVLSTILNVVTVDSEMNVDTDAGVSYFPILRFDIPNGNIDYWDEAKAGGAGWTNVISGLEVNEPYKIADLIFDLLNSSTAGKDFNTLMGAGGTILFVMKKRVTGNLQVVGAPKLYTQGAIESRPTADGDTGNPIIDDFIVSDYAEFGVVTSAALVGLELPFRFHYQRVG